jgi:hypothetical protein
MTTEYTVTIGEILVAVDRKTDSKIDLLPEGDADKIVVSTETGIKRSEVALDGVIGITEKIDSESTHSEIPKAKAVVDAIEGFTGGDTENKLDKLPYGDENAIVVSTDTGIKRSYQTLGAQRRIAGAIGTTVSDDDIPNIKAVRDAINALAVAAGVSFSWGTNNLPGGYLVASTTSERFQLLIDTGQTQTGCTKDGTGSGATTFAIPVCGRQNTTSANLFPYDWNVDWGDGSPVERLTGAGGTQASGNNTMAGGVEHDYGVAGEYTITITPAGSKNAWLAAFGTGVYNQTSGAQAVANRNKIVTAQSPITVAMHLADGFVGASSVNLLLGSMFASCRGLNFHISEEFAFNSDWDAITAFGHNIMREMFRGCLTLQTVPTTFKLPNNIIAYGNGCLFGTWNGCTALASVQTPLIPPIAISYGTSFFESTFNGCTNLQTLSADFTFANLGTPSSSGAGFNSTFKGCTSLILPANFRLQNLTEPELNRANMLLETFLTTTNKLWDEQPVSATTMLGLMASMVPATAKNTFRTGSDLANSQTYGASRWGTSFNALDDNWK